jgi:transposase-like protein
MARIVPGLDSVEQHLQCLENDPEAYRPERCPRCGKAGMHGHGHYERKAPPGEGVAFVLGALFIPRFLCPHCRSTCSRLPTCVAPWRQYLWKAQQAVLERLLAGASRRELARAYAPSRRTIGRWWQWLKARFVEQSFHLRSGFADLGRAMNLPAFWRACFEQMGLAEAMAWIEHEGVIVP